MRLRLSIPPHLLHEGGYTIQSVDSSEQRLIEPIGQQQHANDITLFDFEKDLRNDRESFNQVRKLSPTCQRFRVVDPEGQDIRNRQFTDTGDSHYCVTPAHSTRVECREPQLSVYCSGMGAQHGMDGANKTGRCSRSNRSRSAERALSSVIEQCAGYHAGAVKAYALVH